MNAERPRGLGQAEHLGECHRPLGRGDRLAVDAGKEVRRGGLRVRSDERRARRLLLEQFDRIGG